MKFQLLFIMFFAIGFTKSENLVNNLSVKEKFTENMSTSTTEMMPLSIRDLNIIVFFDIMLSVHCF